MVLVLLLIGGGPHAKLLHASPLCTNTKVKVKDQSVYMYDIPHTCTYNDIWYNKYEYYVRYVEYVNVGKSLGNKFYMIIFEIYNWWQ